MRRAWRRAWPAPAAPLETTPDDEAARVPLVADSPPSGAYIAWLKTVPEGGPADGMMGIAFPCTNEVDM